jgi:two-component system LytT family sensor kinase
MSCDKSVSSLLYSSYHSFVASDHQRRNGFAAMTSSRTRNDPRPLQISWREIAIGILLLIIARSAARVVSNRVINAHLIVSSVRLVLAYTLYWAPASVGIAWIARRMQVNQLSTLARLSVFLLAAAIVLVTEPAWVSAFAYVLHGPIVPYQERILNRASGTIMLVALAAGIVTVREEMAALNIRDRAALELKRNREVAELYLLSLQIQPHFLFNTLQLIAEAAHISESMGRQVLRQLRQLVLVAFDLGATREKSVADEISFLRSYMEIQMRRFGDEIRLEVAADEDVMGAAIPPLLIQPLVENSIRHGLRVRRGAGTVRVGITLQSDKLRIVVEDDGVGVRRGYREGLGLRITRQRLSSLYGDNQQVEINSTANGTKVTIMIPFLRPAASETLSGSNTNRFAQAEVDRPQVGSTGVRILLAWGLCVGIGLGFPMLKDTKAALLPMVGNWYTSIPFWIALTVAAIATTQRTTTMSTAKAFWIHAAVATALIIMHVLGGPLINGVFSPQLTPTRYTAWIPLDAAAYALTVSFTRAGDLARWAQERTLDARRLRQMLASKDRRLEIMRLHQGLLIASLDTIANRTQSDSFQAAAIECADFLRSLFDLSTQHWIDISTDAQLAAQFIGLRGQSIKLDTGITNYTNTPLSVPPGTLAALADALMRSTPAAAAQNTITFAANQTGDTFELSVVSNSDAPNDNADEVAALSAQLERLLGPDTTLNARRWPGFASLTLASPSMAMY